MVIPSGDGVGARYGRLFLGIGLGMRGIRIPDMFKLSAVVALFHVLMPLAGMAAGHWMGALLGDVAEAAGGGLLVVLGLHMIYSAWKGEDDYPFKPTQWAGLILFALSVSIDSFSVGISMGLFDSHLLLTVILFGTFGGCISVLGLAIGSRVSASLGGYGEAFGGVILLIFGIKVLI